MRKGKNDVPFLPFVFLACFAVNHPYLLSGFVVLTITV